VRQQPGRRGHQEWFTIVEHDVVYVRNWNKKTPEEQARKTYERAQKLEAEFLEYFTGD